MLHALLYIPEYWHGGRAVRMLLELCTSNDGRISASAVPPIHQLNMLVDGKVFLNRHFPDGLSLELIQTRNARHSNNSPPPLDYRAVKI
jgi:hypothetical protein